MDSAKRQHGVVLRPDDRLLAAHHQLYGTTPAARLRSLADALSTSPAWGELRTRLRIAVRAEPTPLLAVLGDPAPADDAALRALGWQVADSLRRLRPVTYGAAEAACALLAGRLRAHLGADTVQRCRVVPLPRGGLIVAGMVAYFLGLHHKQFGADRPTGGVTVVVDDCMLSGTQLRRWLREHDPAGPVVVAHLHSHAELRSAIEAAEPAVDRCISAGDLTDHATARDDHRAWVERWRQRTPESYWIGNPDHVCYPWNEPETLMWSATSDRAVPGWRVAPPSFCVKNRADRRSDDDISVCVPAHGAVRPADNVVWTQIRGGAVVAAAAGGSSVRLDGVAAAMWTALTTAGDVDGALDVMTAQYDVDAARLRDDLHDVVTALRGRSLLA